MERELLERYRKCRKDFTAAVNLEADHKENDAEMSFVPILAGIKHMPSLEQGKTNSASKPPLSKGTNAK